MIEPGEFMPGKDIRPLHGTGQAPDHGVPRETPASVVVDATAEREQVMAERMRAIAGDTSQLIVSIVHGAASTPRELSEALRGLRDAAWVFLRDFYAPKIIVELHALLGSERLAIAGEEISGAREWATSSGWFFWFDHRDRLVEAHSPDGIRWGESDMLRVFPMLPQLEEPGDANPFPAA